MPEPERYGQCEDCGCTMNLKDGVPTLVAAPKAKDKKEGDHARCNPCQKKADDRAPWPWG